VAIQRRAPDIDSSQWSLELLRRLDWRRFHDLAETMLSRAGYMVEGERSEEDGSRILSIRRGSRRENRADALLFLAGWEAFRISERHFANFVDEMERCQVSQGVLVTPGDFSAGAARAARSDKFELIDGDAFMATMQDLPESDLEWLLAVTTAGEFASPTCPQCGLKMQWRESECPPHRGPMPDLGFADKTSVMRELRARTLAIGHLAEVHFLKPVYCDSLHIEGRAFGHFIVDGPVTISAGAILTGLVAARAINVHLGGRIDGEAMIQGKGTIQPVKPLPFSPVWGCPAYPECDRVLSPRE
jgi:hypothetical protein